MDIWETKDRRLIAMRDMTAAHLENAEKWVERCLDELNSSLEDYLPEDNDFDALIANLLGRQTMIRREKERRQCAEAPYGQH